MALTKANPNNWGFGEKLTSAQMNTVQTEYVKAIDGYGGGSYPLADDLTVTATTDEITLTNNGSTVALQSTGLVLQGKSTGTINATTANGNIIIDASGASAYAQLSSDDGSVACTPASLGLNHGTLITLNKLPESSGTVSNNTNPIQCVGAASSEFTVTGSTPGYTQTAQGGTIIYQLNVPKDCTITSLQVFWQGTTTPASLPQTQPRAALYEFSKATPGTPGTPIANITSTVATTTQYSQLNTIELIGGSAPLSTYTLRHSTGSGYSYYIALFGPSSALPTWSSDMTIRAYGCSANYNIDKFINVTG